MPILYNNLLLIMKKNNLDTLVLENYEKRLIEMEQDINDNIKIIENKETSDFDKENSQRFLEVYLWRILDWTKRPVFWTATKFWIDFLLSPLNDIFQITLNDLKNVESAKSKIFLNNFKKNEAKFDKLDLLIIKSLEQVESEYSKNFSKIKGKWYYWKLMKI